MGKKDIGIHIAGHLSDSPNNGHIDEELDNWLKESEGNREEFLKYKRIWEEAAILSGNKNYDAGKAWAKVNSQLFKKTLFSRRIRSLTYTVAGVAATLLLVFGLSLFTGMFAPPAQTIKIANEYGSKTFTTLPDGSTVKMNAGSAIEYRFNKQKRIREVIFNGEGFFNVVKDKKPFVIKTNDGFSLKVLGTEFNLTAYSEDNFIRATLVKGKVELTSPENKKITLTPGQIANYDKNTNKLDYFKGEIPKMLSWMDNKLYMDNMPLSEVMVKLERWYNVQIELSNSSIGEKFHYTGVLEEKSITDVLKALSKLSGIQYTSEGNKYTISEKN